MKIWFVVGLLVLIAIVVAQNGEVVTLRFLFWQLSLSRVVLMLLTLAIGIVIGFLGAKMSQPRRRDD